MNKTHVVIVGGGISGLSTAFFLSQKIFSKTLPLKITVLEASDRFGGVLRTFSREGWVMEGGADAFYSGRNDAADLCRILGLEGELVEAAPCFRRFFVLKNKRCFSIPGLPGSFSDVARFLKEPGLCLSSKCRMILEPFIPRRTESGDESVASFVCRRFGEGFYREIAQPLIRGVYMADPGHMSLEAMFPKLRQAEKNPGSLALSFLRRKSSKKKKKEGEFSTLKNGLEGLTRTLVSHLGTCDLRKSSVVKQCASREGWDLCLEDGEKMRADVLCFAMSSCEASRLLSAAAPELSRELAGIRYDSIAAVNFVYRSRDVTEQVFDCGFLVPAFQGEYPFSSLKWLGKTADGKYVLARAFVSGAMMPEVYAEDDETLGQKMQASIRKISGIQTAPCFMNVERYPHALPQYETGHLERVARIEAMALQYPGLCLAGNGLTGFGITDCIARAKDVASGIYAGFWKP